jgi:hypothetical protein
MLRALDFGMNVFPIWKVAIADEERLEGWFGPSRGKSALVPIGAARGSAAQPIATNLAMEDRVPPDCTPYTEISSELRLFQRPLFEWDALHVSVYFTVFPRSQDQNEFRKLIQAWGTMGYYGALGGDSIHCLQEIIFNEETESATFYADMGGAAYPGALAVLIRLLEKFSGGVLAIEAIALGVGPDDE